MVFWVYKSDQSNTRL